MSAAVTAVAKRPVSDHRDRIIVVDPGHGGDDTGAEGPEGALEKTICLGLSQLLAAELQPKYQVVLTRSGDYWLDIPDRVDTANKLKADVFVSLHTGGSYHHQTTGRSVFYFKELSKPPPYFTAEAPLPSGSGNVPELWDTLQARHRAASETLAKRIQSFLQSEGRYAAVTVEGAPLLVLRGADMPAVLLEIGYLTTPLEEKSLLDKNVLRDLAIRISQAIDEHFEKNP